MAFYFSSDTNALYDTDVFPVASLPANKVEITEAVYSELLTKQNQGYVILADGSGNPYTVNQSEASATDIKHAASVATTLALGHVKIGNTMQAANDGTLDLKDGAVTESKIGTGAVTNEKIADGSVTEEKLYSVKDLLADETTLTLTENTNGFTFSVKDGGITTPKIASGSVVSSKIANNAIFEQHIFDGAVTEDKLATQAVGTAKIANNAITTSKIAAGAVVAIHISDGEVTGDKLATQAVGTTKIANNAVTRPKMADDFLFYDPDFASHSSGPSVVFYTLGQIIEERYNKPSNIVVVCNNSVPFILDNILYTAHTKAGYKDSSHLLVVNAYNANLTVVDENDNTLKTIPPNTGALFVCMNEGDANGSGSVWIAIS